MLTKQEIRALPLKELLQEVLNRNMNFSGKSSR